MRQHTFGPGRIALPIIGQGTWNLERDDPAAAIAALRRGIDLGMIHVDTAEMYGSGAVESLVGQAIAGRRDELFLVSKVLPENASRAGTVAACRRSLKRLGTDRLDLYLLHWPGRHPLEETVAGFEELVAAGDIAAYGVSNFNAEEVAAAVEVTGPGKIVCNQVCYHLGARTIEHYVVPRCHELGVTVVGYSPFGSGRFPRPTSPGGKVLARIAEAHGATPRQVALAFLIRGGCFAIPKAARVAHVEDNAGAAALSLGAGDLAALDQAFPRGRASHEVPML